MIASVKGLAMAGPFAFDIFRVISYNVKLVETVKKVVSRWSGMPT